MQFHMMTLPDALGKIAWVRWDFLSQGKILDSLSVVQKYFLSMNGIDFQSKYSIGYHRERNKKTP